MTKATLEPEQQHVVDFEIIPLANRIATLVVKSREERTIVFLDIEKAKELKVNIEKKFHPSENKVKAREVYELALDTEHQFYDIIDQFVAAAKKAINSFDTSESLRVQREQREAQERQEQKEREEKAKREAEAKAAQEAEEKRILEEAQKLEDERQKKIALQKSATESGDAKVAGLAAKEVAKLDNGIKEVVETGQKKIEEIQAKAEEPAPAPLKFTPPPIAVKKLVWKCKVSNSLLACKSVSEGLIPCDAVEFKQSSLNDVGKNYDGQSKIPGLLFWQESTGRI